MYPAQTSMIPVQVALARFLESQGWQAILGNYPYWYLGTTPFRYLTGPILPSVLALLHQALPNLSLFEIMFGLVGVMWVIGGMGVYWLVRELTPPTSEEPLRVTVRGVLVAVFYVLGPIVPFLFRFSDGLYLMAFSLVPFALLVYLRFLRKGTRKLAVCLVALLALVILLDLAVVPSMLLGMAAIFLAQVGWKKAEEKLKRTLVPIACSLILATLWYTPGYWLNSLTGPSLAGKGRLGVIWELSRLLPIALAFALAIFSNRFFKKKNLLRDFCFYWLFIFGFLSFLRFLSDPDFWLDWSVYNLELQFGIAIGLGLFFEDRRQKTEDGSQKAEDRGRNIEDQSSVFSFQNLFSVFRFPSSILLTLYLVLFTFTANKYVLGTFQQNITQTVEYKIGKELDDRVKRREGEKAERVFLSGTTAFWLNAFFDIPQVRGGVDQGSVDPNWRQAVWEVREGTEAEKSIRWLRELEISYLVVHTQESEEFYHDFAYPEKFEGVEGLEKVYDQEGDRIYKLED